MLRLIGENCALGLEGIGTPDYKNTKPGKIVMDFGLCLCSIRDLLFRKLPWCSPVCLLSN